MVAALKGRYNFRRELGTLALAGLSSCSSPVFQADPFVRGSPTAEQVSTSGARPLREGIVYALPKALVPITVERQPVELKASSNAANAGPDNKTKAEQMLQTTLTLGPPLYVPDPDNRFLLRYSSAFTADDTVTVVVGANGLLTSVETRTKDALPEVVHALSDFVTQLGAAAAKSTAVGKMPDGPFKITQVIDPSDPNNRGRVTLKNFLAYYGVTIEIEQPMGLPDFTAANDVVRNQCTVMICYRSIVPYKVTITDGGYSGAINYSRGKMVRGPAPTRVLQDVALIPNGGPIAGVEVVRRALVENKFKLDFSNGVLTSAKYDSGNQFLAAVNIPIDIAKAIVAIPSALFQFRVSSDTSNLELSRENASLKAQTDVAKAKLDLITAQQNLSNKVSGPATSQ